MHCDFTATLPKGVVKGEDFIKYNVLEPNELIRIYHMINTLQPFL